MIEGVVQYQGSKFRRFGKNLNRVVEMIRTFHGKEIDIILWENVDEGFDRRGQAIVEMRDLKLEDYKALQKAIDSAIIQLEAEQ